MTCTASELKAVMAPYLGGSEERYRHWANRRFIYSEGMKAMAEAAGAYWLLDKLATQYAPIYAKAWQDGKASTGIVRLSVSAQNHGSLMLSLADGEPPAADEVLPYTDFPEGDWTFYLGTDELPDGSFITTAILPEEY